MKRSVLNRELNKHLNTSLTPRITWIEDYLDDHYPFTFNNCLAQEMYCFLKDTVNELIWENVCLSNGKIKPSTEKDMKNVVSVIMSFTQQQ